MVRSSSVDKPAQVAPLSRGGSRGLKSPPEGGRATHLKHMIRSYRRIVKLVEQKEPPTRDEMDKACKVFNEAVHSYLKSKHTLCKNQ